MTLLLTSMLLITTPSCARLRKGQPRPEPAQPPTAAAGSFSLHPPEKRPTHKNRSRWLTQVGRSTPSATNTPPENQSHWRPLEPLNQIPPNADWPKVITGPIVKTTKSPDSQAEHPAALLAPLFFYGLAAGGAPPAAIAAVWLARKLFRPRNTPTVVTKTESAYQPYRINTEGEAYREACRRHVGKYPGAIDTVQSIEAMAKQLIHGKEISNALRQ